MSQINLHVCKVNVIFFSICLNKHKYDIEHLTALCLIGVANATIKVDCGGMLRFCVSVMGVLFFISSAKIQMRQCFSFKDKKKKKQINKCLHTKTWTIA